MESSYKREPRLACRGPAILWTRLLCWHKELVPLKPMPQIVHLQQERRRELCVNELRPKMFTYSYGLSPLWPLSWVSRVILFFSNLKQMVHLNLGSPCVSMWVLSRVAVPHLLSQLTHWYLSSVECLTLLCWSNCSGLRKIFLQMGQIGLIIMPSCSSLMCLWR